MTDPAASATVMTVNGPVSPPALGVTLSHEHLVSCFATPVDSDEGWRRVGRRRPEAAADARLYEAPVSIELLGALNAGAPNRDNWTLESLESAIAAATEFAAAGGGAIVDATCIGIGRNPGALRQIADATGLAIIMGSGWYHPAWAPEIARREVDSLAGEIVRDLVGGVEGIRAGMIGEIGPLNLAEHADARLLRAVAIAARHTGAPVCIDRSPSQAGTLAVLDLLAAEGVDLSRVAIGHCAGLLPQADAIDQLLERGVFLQFDQLGDIPTVLTEVSDHDVVLAILALADRGSADRVLVSHDLHRKIDLSEFGGNGYGFIAQQYVPYLKMFGADDALLQAVTSDNPQRFLATTSQEPS